MKAQTSLVLVLAICSGALLTYSGIRAYRLSFTHDESLSHMILLGDAYWTRTANHHPLNTQLMRWSRQWLGSREWELRWPNVGAHLLYLACSLVLLRSLHRAAAILMGFALLHFDPFVLDFFGLARGYGLALGLSMMAFFFLYEAWQQSTLSRRLAFLLPALACAALADMANYTWLNLHLPLLVASVVILLYRGRVGNTLNWAAVAAAVALTGVNAWFIRRLAFRIWALSVRGELYTKGVHRFLDDTLGSLTETYIYLQPFSLLFKEAMMLGVLIALGLLGVAVAYRAVQDRRISFAVLLLAMLLLAVAIPVGEHVFLGMEYPFERTALYYIPMGGLFVAFGVDQIITSTGQRARLLVELVSILLVGCMAVHLMRTANLHHTLTWYYDSETKNAMADVGRYLSSSASPTEVVIGNNWLFEPTINFYRETRQYDRLSRAIRRARVSIVEYDLVYCFTADLENQSGFYSVLQRYPRTGTVLIKVDRTRLAEAGFRISNERSN
jgi:hypothetical protein